MSLSKRTVVENNSIINHYVQCILKSGLLLDEDLDYLMSQYNADDEKSEENGLSMFQKILGVMSFTTTMLIVQRKYSVVLISITASPFIILGLRQLRNMIHRRNHKRNLEIVIETSQKISKMNRMIYEYFKARSIIDPSTVSIVNPYTKGMKQLIKTIFQEQVDLLYSFRIIIRQFGAFVPSLSADYAYLENLEFEDFQSSNITSVDDCVIYLKKLYDIYVLLASNCLTCLALALCPRLLTKREVDIDEILNKIVPKMKTICMKCYNNINKKFDDCKYYYLNKSQRKKPVKKPKPDAASKLKISTYNTMVYTTEILEKSKIIFNKLHEVDLKTSTEKEKLGKCLYELRGHVFDYYESLDVLCKLYDVHINATQDKPYFNNFEVINEENKLVNDGIIKDASFNPVEPSDDEEFELYIGANETSSESASFSYQEEQESRKFASLLSQELKHKLKTHAQFIAARKKRGIIDEEPEPVQPPEEIENPRDEGDNPPIIFMNPRIIVPPPPPPPLPPLDLGPYGGNVGSLYTVDDFLESIEAAIRSRNSVEEVFGNDNDD